MKIVVFGGSGFLGSHVADAFADKGHQVVVYDSKRSGYLGKNKEMVIGDIMDEELVLATLKGSEIVCNFAGIADIDECVARPLETVKYNVYGNAVILDACRQSNIKRYLFASSAYVYSNYGSFYKSSKQACELFIHSYHEKYQLPYTILRYGSLYGDRADNRNSIYRMLKEAVTRGTILYHGTGEEVREYIHVRDAAQLTVRILSPEYENTSVMLTGVRAMPYKDILGMIKEILGNKVEIVYTQKNRDAHYNITPYNYKKPELGKKLFSDSYIEIGAGLIECIEEIVKEVGHEAVLI